MGLSLSVLVAICFLLPGASFLFGLTKLHNPNAPGIGLEQYLSVSLATAVLAAIAFQGAWLLGWSWITHGLGWPTPDPAQFFSLLGGDISKAKGPAALDSLSSYPGRICLYFVALPFLTGILGKGVNFVLKRRALASWYELLTPKEALFVWLTADVHLDGCCYLFAGPVREFSVSKDGALDRVVLRYAMRRALKPESAAEESEQEWTEISGERTVLLLKDSKTINLDYFYLAEDTVEPEETSGDSIGDHSDDGESGDDDVD